MWYRILFNMLVGISIVVVPWYMWIFFALAGFFLYDNYIEGLVWAVMVDAAFGGWMWGDSWWSLLVVYKISLITVAVYIVSFSVKDYLSWYNE